MGLLNVMCCGRGVLEIKCPFSISNTVASSKNVSYIKEVPFDQARWLELKASATFFFTKHMAYGLVKKTFVASNVSQLTDKDFHQ